MSNRRQGVLPRQTLANLIRSGFIQVPPTYLNPASIDLPISAEAYRIENTILPHAGERVRDLLGCVGATTHDLNTPLEVGVLYLIRIEGQFKFPNRVYGYANPKSSTGRLNLFCRIVADHVHQYDTLEMRHQEGWEGECWVLVRPDSFPVLLHPGIALVQIRLFDGYTKLDEVEVQVEAQEHGLIRNTLHEVIKPHVSNDGSIFLSLDLDGGFIGYRARVKAKAVNLEKKGHHEEDDFFERVHARNGSIELHKNSFYILSTQEYVVVPPHLSAELRPIDVRLGEFRTHAAGYIDPGWGWNDEAKNLGQPITLEVIPYESRMIREGDVVARLRYERMKEPPDVPYSSAESNYVGQRKAKLSKHFKQS